MRFEPKPDRKDEDFMPLATLKKTAMFLPFHCSQPTHYWQVLELITKGPETMVVR